MSTAEENEKRLAQMEGILSFVLRYGVILCLLLVGVGLALRLLGLGTVQLSSQAMVHLLTSGGVLAHYVPPSGLMELVHGTLSIHPDIIMASGLVLLIGLPISRVAITVVMFLIERDYIYFVVTSIVLTALLSGIFLGKAF